MRQLIASFALLALTTSNATRAQPAPDTSPGFTSVTLIAQSIRPDCIRYCVVGACAYLVCTPLGCNVVTVPRISHRFPDFVVSVYNNPGDNPWLEAKPISTAAWGAAQGVLASLASGTGVIGGNRPSTDAQQTDRNPHVRYKEVEVIGHPLAVAAQSTPLVDLMPSIPFMCPTEAVPLFPYFLSEADALAWRTGATELAYPASWLPGLREVGPWPAMTWGPVHPRHGFINQAEEAKASAVIAQRAVDIVTRMIPPQPHVYVPSALRELPADVERPGPSCEKTDVWQKIQTASTPTPATCLPPDSPFGFDPLYNERHPNIIGDGDYAWQHWRRYECCAVRPGILLAHVSIPAPCDTPDLGGLFCPI